MRAVMYVCGNAATVLHVHCICFENIPINVCKRYRNLLCFYHAEVYVLKACNACLDMGQL